MMIIRGRKKEDFLSIDLNDNEKEKENEILDQHRWLLHPMNSGATHSFEKKLIDFPWFASFIQLNWHSMHARTHLLTITISNTTLNNTHTTQFD